MVFLFDERQLQYCKKDRDLGLDYLTLRKKDVTQVPKDTAGCPPETHFLKIKNEDIQAYAPTSLSLGDLGLGLWNLYVDPDQDSSP